MGRLCKRKRVAGTLAPDAAGEVLGKAVTPGRSQMCFVSVVPHLKIFVLGEEMRGIGTNTYVCKKKACLSFMHWRNCFYVVCKNVTFIALPGDSSEVEVFGDIWGLLPQSTKKKKKSNVKLTIPVQFSSFYLFSHVAL